MAISASSRAAGVGVTAKNTVFRAGAVVMPRKILLIGTYDPAITSIADEVPALLTSPEQAAATYGAGFMLHRLAMKSFAGSNGVETWALPQAEVAGAQAVGTITITGPATGDGTISLYIAGDRVASVVADGKTATAIASGLAADINAVPNLPVTAAVNGGVPEQVDITAKSKGLYGNLINLSLNWGPGEELPPGVAVAIVQPTGGTGVPSMYDALAALGTGDEANEMHFTDVNHGYMADSDTLDELSIYNGVGNEAVGLYSDLVSRPFRSLIGDVAPGAGALSSLITFTDGRLTDRTTGVVAVPGSPCHPAEIAAEALGILARLQSNRAEQTAIGQILPSVIPGVSSDRWTSGYSSRDLAVRSGISPTKVVGGAVILQNVVSFFRPATIPVESNIYASMRNIGIVQNVLTNVRAVLESEKYLGCSIVESVAKVANIIDRQKARDTQAVLDDMISLAFSFRDQAWVYEVDDFTIPNIQIQVRPGAIGFDVVMPLILSGELGILTAELQFDASISVLL